MTHFTNLDFEKENDQGNTVINTVLLNMYWRWAITSYLCSISFVENYTDYISRDGKVIFLTYIKWLRLHQGNKNKKK